MAPMKCVWLVALVCGCFGSERNPAFCGDGICIDPERPFCDIDASFSENPGTCVAVSCTPGAFEQCRGDSALVCAGGGNNFDVVQCPLGCAEAASGCRQCTESSQCDAMQVCDPTTSSCRGCVADDDCDSKVCDVEASRCVSEAEIVYVAPLGSGGTCTQTSPCTFSTAAALALARQPPSIVRVLPGPYTEGFSLPTPSFAASFQTLPIVASGVTVSAGAMPAVQLAPGAKAAFRGLEIINTDRPLLCGAAGSDTAEVALRDASITGGGTFELHRCTFRVERTSMVATGDWAVSDRSFVDADRVDVRQTGVWSLIVGGPGSQVRVRNSVLHDVRLVLIGLTSPTTNITFSHTTLAYSIPELEATCSNARPPNLNLVYENSILATSSGNVLRDPLPNGACTFANSLLSTQASPPPGTLVGDPKFVNFASGDYHLLPGSAAIDIGLPGTLTTDHDFDGVARPQGAQPDLGAYEFKP